MNVEIIRTDNRADWLARRQADITASVAGALFGVHEYVTRYGLWALKTGRFHEDAEETPAMRRGRLLEPVAVQLLREMRPDWTITHNTDPQLYFRDPVTQIGATPDVLVETLDRGRGVVQVKSVEQSIFRQKWQPEPHAPFEPPIWIAIQATIEARLTGADFALVGALVVGHGVDLHLIEIPEVQGLYEQVETAVREFWEMVDEGREPDPDYAHDTAVLARIYAPDDAEEVDLTADNRIQAIVQEWAEIKTRVKADEKAAELLRAEVLHKLAGAAVGWIGGGRAITHKTIARKGYTVEPTTFRQLRIPAPA